MKLNFDYLQHFLLIIIGKLIITFRQKLKHQQLSLVRQFSNFNTLKYATDIYNENIYLQIYLIINLKSFFIGNLSKNYCLVYKLLNIQARRQKSPLATP